MCAAIKKRGRSQAVFRTQSEIWLVSDHLSLMAAPYYLRFRAIALTLRAGLRGLRPPSAPQRWLRDILLMSRPPLLWGEEGCIPPEQPKIPATTVGPYTTR